MFIYNTCDFPVDRRCHGRPVDAVLTIMDYDRDKPWLSLFSTIMASKASMKWDREPLSQGMLETGINLGAKGGRSLLVTQ